MIFPTTEKTMTTTSRRQATRLSPRRLAKLARNQADRDAQSRRLAVLSKAMFSADDETFVEHADGTRERTTTCSVERMAHFLKHRRCFDKAECLEECNAWTLGFLTSSGYAVKRVDPQTRVVTYWVTERAAEVYKLPNNTGPNGFTFKFAPAKS
jgi:hypothetical protein